jgi:putative pyruvate formate lyase activating enzyme
MKNQNELPRQKRNRPIDLFQEVWEIKRSIDEMTDAISASSADAGIALGVEKGRPVVPAHPCRGCYHDHGKDLNLAEMFELHAQRHRHLSKGLDGGGRFLRPRRDFVPAYLKTYELGQLTEKVVAAQEMLRSCKVCPRDCQVNRRENKTGVCKTGRYARVSSAFAHFGEEDCLRGWNGSGTIFFSGCNLGCVFCQNFEISHLAQGRELDASQLAAGMLRLQAAGCHNINFVTPEHVVPQVLEALLIAIPGGLRLPLVYNTGAYDSLESIGLMDGVVDVYMPDFKLWDPQLCAKYLRAGDYAETARRVIKAMHQQVRELRVDEDGLALRGVLVRHLVMPSLLEETRSVLHWLAAELSPDTYVNLMDQYHPAHKAETDPRFSEINRRISGPEFREALAYAEEAGLWRLDARWA